jgi:hypothetical protein
VTVSVLPFRWTKMVTKGQRAKGKGQRAKSKGTPYVLSPAANAACAAASLATGMRYGEALT